MNGSDPPVGCPPICGEEEAIGLVRPHVRPNPFDVDGTSFHFADSDEGCLVFMPQTVFHGSEARLVWWIAEDGPHPLTKAAQKVTPGLLRPVQAQITAPDWQEVKAACWPDETADLH